MRFLVLAAGQGTRLRPLTDNIPKCMVPLQGKPLLEHLLDTARQVGLTDLHVATGYREEVIDYPGVVKHQNPRYDSTNMVATLFCAEEIMDDELIVSYGDIVYQPDVLAALVASSAEVSVVVDREWKRYWQARMENPLDDAETLKLGSNGEIRELGKKAKSYDEIEGQYIGLMKFRKDALEKIRPFYHRLDKEARYDGKDFENMYMTSFLQLIADRLMPLTPVFIENGWMEVDAVSDLEFTRFLYRQA